MSAQGVKKRLGSRRQVKSKSPEVDEFTTTETTGRRHRLSTESAEDVPEVSNNRRKLGSSRRSKRPHPGNDLGVSNEATEDDPLDTSQVSSSSDEVKVTQVPEESHRLSELDNQRPEKDEISATLTHDESLQDYCWVSESHLISEDAEPSTDTQPDEEMKENLSQSGGAVQTSDPTQVCDSEINTEPVEAEESQGVGGFEEVAEPLSQSSDEYREAEPSSAGTEEPPEGTHWLVETGTVEKESELMCEKEIVMSEPPESLRSGSPPEVQNLHTSHPEPDPEPEKESELMCEKEIVISEPPLNFRSGSPPEVPNLHTSHPEPDPEPSIPKSASLPEDLYEQGAASKVELSDDDDDEEEATTLMQQMDEISLNENEHSRKTQSEAGSSLDCDLQEDVELIPASTAMMTTDIIISEDIQDHQPAQEMNPVVSEENSLQEDTYLSQNIKDDDTTEMTGSQSNLWRTTYHNGSATPEDPHVVQKDQDFDAKETVEDPGAERPFEDPQKLAESSDTLTQEEAQEMSPSSEPTHAELTSSEPPLALPDPATEGLGECDPGDDRLDFQERPERRRRKMGSSRRTRKNQEDEQVCSAEPTESSSTGIQAGGGGGSERPAQVSWEENTETSVELWQDVATVSSDPQSTHSSLISHTDFAAGAAGRSASDSQSLYPTVIVEGADLWDGGSNTDSSTEPSHLDEFTAPEAHISSCLIKPSQCLPPPSSQSTGDDHESLRCLAEEQEQPLQSAEESTVDLETAKSQLDADDEQEDLEDPDKVAEGGSIENLDPANTGPNLSLASRGGAMGSTFRNIGSHRKEEDLHHQQRVGNETADKRGGDGSPGPREGPAKGPHLPEPAPLQTSEEAPAAGESDRQPTTSPENDVMSYASSSGRRRKLGSHRKSSRPQGEGSKPGSDIGSIAEELTVKRSEEAKMSEVDDSEKKSTNPVSANSDLSVAPNTLVHFRPLLESRSSRDNRSLSLGSSGAEDVKSNSYSVIMVGNSNVGKTSFMRRVLNGSFSSDLPSSVGLDMCLWQVTVDGKRVLLQLWDTAGQERFHSVTRQLFHKAHAFLLMYDITSSQSFTAVSYWANCIQEGATENVTVLLLGNKSDCAGRQVPAQEGEVLAKEYAFGFMECSAATGQNVNESLEAVARILSNKVKLREETTMLQNEPRQKKSSGCC